MAKKYEIDLVNENYVVVKQIKNEEIMYGNIVVPDMGKEKAMIGTVVNIGPGYFNFGTFIKTKLEIGNVVVFPSFGGQRIEIQGEEYLVYKEQDIILTLKEVDE